MAPKVPAINDNQKADDKLLPIIGHDRRGLPGGEVELRSLNYGELDDLFIPFTRIANNFAEIHNELWCKELQLRSLTGAGTLKIELEGEKKRPVQAEGWLDETVDYCGRTKVCQDKEVCHYSGVSYKLCNVCGEEMSDLDVDALVAKHAALGPLLNRLAHCQNAINAAGAGWKFDNPLGAYSYSLTKLGGLEMLNVYRQPCYVKGGGALSLMQKAKMLGDMEGGYPSMPPRSVRQAVSAFNKAANSIRMLLASEGKPLWKAVGEAVKWFKDNGKGELKLSVKLNGTELNVDPLKSLVKAKKAEAKDAATDAANVVLEDGKAAVEADVEAALGGDPEPLAKSAALAWFKNPPMPSFDDFTFEKMVMACMPKGLKELLDGNVDLSFELVGPGASALDEAPAAIKAVLLALAGDDPASVLATVGKKMKLLSEMLKPEDKQTDEKMKGVTKSGAPGEERELTYEPDAKSSAYSAEVKTGGKDVGGEFVRFGFGGSTKYTQSLYKLCEEVPTRAEEAAKLVENIISKPNIYLDITDPTKTKMPNYHALDVPRIPITFMAYAGLVKSLPLSMKRSVTSLVAPLVYSVLAFQSPDDYAGAPLDAEDKVVVAVPEDMGAAEAAPAPKGGGKADKGGKAAKGGDKAAKGDDKKSSTKGGNKEVEVDSMGDWKIGILCPCLADGCGLCCCIKTCVFEPCVWGSIMATGGDTIGAGGCCKETCCFYLLPPCRIHSYRASIGKAYGIKPGSCDCCKDFICCCCSSIQLMNEVKVREDGAWAICGAKKGGAGPVANEMER